MLEPHTNAELAAALDTLELEVDNFFLLWAAVLIFVMQCGFGMLSAGLIRAHSVKSLLMKNVLDAAWGAIIWWLFGYGLACALRPAAPSAPHVPL
jgi:ammonia channel protein AmtB